MARHFWMPTTKWLRLSNARRAELLTKPALELWARSKDREQVLKILEENRAVTDIEVDLRSTTGKPRTALTSLQIYPELGYLEGTLHDITERKLAEKELQKFKTISDRATYGTSIAEFDGNIVYCNAAFARMHGYAQEALIGKQLSIFHTDAQMPHVNALNQQLCRDGYYDTN